MVITMNRRVRPALAIVLALGLAATVSAHMKLARSQPDANATLSAPPAAVKIWFTQMPDAAVSRLKLEGPAGPVALGKAEVARDKSLSAAVEGTVDDGTYTVSWQAAGDDGHLQKGTFTFTVRRAR